MSFRPAGVLVVVALGALGGCGSARGTAPTGTPDARGAEASGQTDAGHRGPVDSGRSRDARAAADGDAVASRDAAIDVLRDAPRDVLRSDVGVDASPASSPCLPFTMPSSSALFASGKRVFAHYFYPFPLSIGNVASNVDYYNKNYLSPAGENNKWLANGGFLRQRPLPVAVGPSATYVVDDMEKEVKMAIASGITGFTIDILGSDQASAGSHLDNLLAAAAAVDSRFKIVVMPDLAALGANQSAIEAVITFVAGKPAAYHLPDGRLVVTAFDASVGSVAFWTTVLDDLRNAGIKVAFVPTFLGWAAHAAAFSPISYGLGDWGTATPSAAAGFESAPSTAHGYGEIFMLPILSQQYRPKSFLFWEAENSLAFRNGWNSAIAGGSDWVQIVTWSDFSESGQIEPYTDKTLAPDIGTGFYDLNAYYASWFLTGQAPTITHDVLYYFYRREPVGALAPAQSQPTTVASGGTGQDNIELLGFLTAAGTLGVTLGGQTFTKDVPAGISSFTVPLRAGTPTFSLTRGGASAISFPGKIPIYDAGGLPDGTLDLTYWTGSASASGVCNLTTPQ